MADAGKITATVEIDSSKVPGQLNAVKGQATTAANAIESSFKKTDIGSGLTASLSKSKGDFASIGEELGGSLTSQIGSSFGPIGGLAANAATALGPIGIAAGVAGAALIGIGSASVGVASGFQSSMSKVTSVLGGSQEDFNKLSNAARDAGATTTFSASQAADGLYFLASAGYSSDEAVATLGDTLNLAAAGGMDLARSSEMVTTDLAVFGKGAGDAGELTNLLAAAASASNSDVGQMGDALAKVGGTANALGMSMESTTAELALMANGGIKSAEAGTKLNAILGVLMETSSSGATQKQVDAMTELGVTADQLNPQLHSQAEIFGLLNEKHMTAAQSLAIFGRENVSAASYITANAGSLAGLQTKITGTQKATEMAKQMNDNFAGSQKQLSSAVEEAEISIGNLLLPALTGIVNIGTAVIGAATSIGHSFYEIVTSSQAFGAISSAFSKMGDSASAAFGIVTSVVGPAWDALGGGNTVMSLLQAAFNAITAPTTAFCTIMGKLADETKSLYTAITPAATAIGGALADGIKTASAYIQALQEAFTSLVSNSSTVQGLVSAFDNLKNKLGEIGSFWGDIASKVLSGLTTAIPQAISGLISAVTGAFGKTGQQASDAFSNAIKGSPLGAVFGFVEGVSGRANEIMNTGKKTGDTIATGVKQSTDLAKSTGDVLDSDTSKTAVKKSAQDLASEFTKAYGSQFEAGMTLINGKWTSNQSSAGFNSAPYTGSAKIGNFTYSLDMWKLQLKTPIGDYQFSSTADMMARFPSIMEDILGRALSPLEKAEMLLDLQSQIKISSKIKIDAVDLWDKQNTERSWEKFTSENKDLANHAGSELSLNLYNAINSIGSADYAGAIQKWADKVGTNFEGAQATLKTDLNNVMAALAKPGSVDKDILNQSLGDLVDADVIGPQWKSQIIEAGSQIQAGFEIPIQNTAEWAKSELGKIGKEASDAWKDGLTQKEADAITAFGPEIEYIKKNFPTTFSESGGESMLNLIKAIKDNGGDVEKAMKQIGENSGEAFSTSLLDGANLDVTLANLAADPATYTKYITNPMVYAANDGYEQTKTIIGKVQDAYKTGYDPSALTDDIISSFSKVSDYIPGWVDTLNNALSTGKISLSQYLTTFDYYSTQIDQATASNEKATTSTNNLSTASQKATGHTATFSSATTKLGTDSDATTAKLVAMGLAINPLAEISGKGISVSFSPAHVVADQASASLRGAGDAVKIGLNLEGQRIAVIGSVAQQQFAAAGGRWISDSATAGARFAANVNSAASSLASAVGYVSQVGMWNNATGAKTPTATGHTYATGTKTDGPQFAMIGEDGPAHPEYVIPTKTKRWDLLYAAMRAYGIPGYAEGVATGTGGGAAEGDAPPLSATFGISGLASMSKGVQKIINDLKDFFRISWGIIKSEASTYWKSIEKVITDEVTIVRDAAWQGALDIRNSWISSNAAILADSTASYAAIWPAVEPSMISIHDGIIGSFQDAESQVVSVMDQMASDAMTSLSSFQSDWSGVWSQLLADLSSTSSQITAFLAAIAAQISNIQVNVQVGSGGGYSGGSGGSGGGSSPDYGDMGDGSSGGAIVNPDGSANFIDKDCFGNNILVNALKYTNPDGKVSYINPMSFIDNGGISGYQGSGNAGGSSGGGYSGGAYGSNGVFGGGASSNGGWGSSAPVYGNSGVSVPGGSISGFFSAEGGLFDKPSVTHVAEKGVEMVLPTKLSRMFLSLADAGLGKGAASGSGRIVIEDHTEHHWYMDGKEVTNQIMKNVQKKIQLRGGVSAV